MTGPATIADGIEQARSLGVERIEAQWILGRVLERSRGWLAAHADAALAAADALAFAALVARRADGEPLAYLFGEQAFGSLTLQVDRRVLVPRADTGTLVAWALERIDAIAGPAPRVVDLGTGSGAIALSIRQARPAAEVWATDLSPEALDVARINADRLESPCRFILGRWWEAVGEARFDLALSNPPYIALGDPHLPALRHEPSLALVAGPDGLDAIRAILDGAPAHLDAGGWLLVEHGHDQGQAVRRLFDAAGFAGVGTRRDDGGHERCTGGRVPIG